MSAAFHHRVTESQRNREGVEVYYTENEVLTFLSVTLRKPGVPTLFFKADGVVVLLVVELAVGMIGVRARNRLLGYGN